MTIQPSNKLISLVIAGFVFTGLTYFVSANSEQQTHLKTVTRDDIINVINRRAPYIKIIVRNTKVSHENIKYLGYISDEEVLINTYDKHNIMVLPSFTEASPYVVDESLVRKRPVIIFEDIDYIVRDKKGIFVTKRDIDSFLKTTKYIMENYAEIQKNMEKNILPTKKDMIKQISDIINNQNS